MIKKVCDYCGTDKDLIHYIVPKLEKVRITGGKKNVVLADFGTKLVNKEIDLCPYCAIKLANKIDSVD